MPLALHTRMDMSGMVGGEMSSNSSDSSFSHECSMNMLWNWDTIDSCFVSEQWHVNTKGKSSLYPSSLAELISRIVGFAFSIIGIFLITIAVEAIRRAMRNYDRMLIAKHADADKKTTAGPSTSRPTMKEQFVRGLFYGIQFSAAYMLMLIAMSYNGFALFAIFLGGAAGYVFFAADTLTLGLSEESSGAVRGACC